MMVMMLVMMSMMVITVTVAMTIAMTAMVTCSFAPFSVLSPVTYLLPVWANINMIAGMTVMPAD